MGVKNQSVLGFQYYLLYEKIVWEDKYVF